MSAVYEQNMQERYDNARSLVLVGSPGTDKQIDGLTANGLGQGASGAAWTDKIQTASDSKRQTKT